MNFMGITSISKSTRQNLGKYWSWSAFTSLMESVVMKAKIVNKYLTLLIKEAERIKLFGSK
jgi:DNA-binding transcriptional regulator PaaX